MLQDVSGKKRVMTTGDQMAALLSAKNGVFVRQEPAVTKPVIKSGNGLGKTNGRHCIPFGKNALFVLSMVHVNLALGNTSELVAEFKSGFATCNPQEKIEVANAIQDIISRRRVASQPVPYQLGLIMDIARYQG